MSVIILANSHQIIICPLRPLIKRVLAPRSCIHISIVIYVHVDLLSIDIMSLNFDIFCRSSVNVYDDLNRRTDTSHMYAALQGKCIYI